MTDWYCRAAQDGNTTMLRDITARQANSADEDGMTPTLWSSYHGHLDTLRLLVGRGGDPEKCDNFGNTALHCGAAMGHLSCVTFLVNFGVNVFALDNDLHTAKNLAEIRSHQEVLKFLDHVIDKQEASNKKSIRAVKEKALRDAQKRIKNFERRLRKYDKIILQKESKNEAQPPIKQKSRGIASSISKNTRSFFRLPANSTNGSIQTTEVKSPANYSQALPVTENTIKNSALEHCIMNDGVNDVLSAAGSNNEVMFSRPSRLHHVAKTNMESSLFDRPGFGSVSFRSNLSASLSCLDQQYTALSSTPEQISDLADQSGGQDGTICRGDMSDASAESLGFESHTAHQVDNSSDSETVHELASMHLFLSAAGVTDFSANFAREHIDLAALMLLDDSDLASLGIPLGPRRKLLRCIQLRKIAMENPGSIGDTSL